MSAVAPHVRSRTWKEGCLLLATPAISKPELLARAAQARAMLSACRMCELRCGVDRCKGERGACGLTDQTWCFKRHVSYAEELELLPSYMVYLGACNFRCGFCVQAPACFVPGADPRRLDQLGGPFRVEAAAAARDFERIVQRGAKSINLLGGEPSLHLHTLLEIAAEAEAPLPLVLNSNMYMTPEVIELLDGVIGLYVADFKFGSDACARRIAGIPNYLAVTTRNLLMARSTSSMIVRHLVMPGHIECCLRPVAAWMRDYMADVPFTLMTGYVPAYKAAMGESAGLGELGRCLSDAEAREAEQMVAAHGLRRSA